MTLADFIARTMLAAETAEHAEHEALEHIGARVEETAKSLLGHEQDGWSELADYTLREKDRLSLPSPSPLLRKGEHIRDTIEHHVEGNRVEIGSNSQVAQWQEEGTTKIPPRPFLSKAVVRDEHEIEAILKQAIRKIL